MAELTHIPTWAECQAQGRLPEVLFWVGCAGSFDDRAKKITKAFAKLLQSSQVSFAVLGAEESCTGDPAKRAGNEFLFQMKAISNIEILNSYDIKNVITTCPHCFNTIKNEYPELGGNYNVIHHTTFINNLIKDNKITISGGYYKGKKITYHDPCYLGRANGIYEAPREVIKKLDAELVEMKSCKSKSLCCGAGGAQMFKDAEKGDKEINILRTEDALETKPNIIATGCPYCKTMMTDGIKFKQKETQVIVKDIAELIAEANHL